MMKFNAFVPELSVTNIAQSKFFYTELLGFYIEYERREDRFAFLSFHGAQFMLEQRNGHWETGELHYPFGRGINFQITVPHIAPLVARLREHNIALFREPFMSEYAVGETSVREIEFLVQDPDGYLLRFSQRCNEENS
ncbi:bleomycin resistance protein [Caryophanon latum]|nr:VOC family protein [Caryophanon latum]